MAYDIQSCKPCASDFKSCQPLAGEMRNFINMSASTTLSPFSQRTTCVGPFSSLNLICSELYFLEFLTLILGGVLMPPVVDQLILINLSTTFT